MKLDSINCVIEKADECFLRSAFSLLDKLKSRVVFIEYIYIIHEGVCLGDCNLVF